MTIAHIRGFARSGIEAANPAAPEPDAPKAMGAHTITAVPAAADTDE